jgi:hypothetical protein
MENYSAFVVLFSVLGFILKLYDTFKQREQEKMLAKTLEKFDKHLKTKSLD